MFIMPTDKIICKYSTLKHLYLQIIPWYRLLYETLKGRLAVKQEYLLGLIT